MIRRSLHILFVMLALLALAYTAYDYTYGHTLDEKMNLEYCPVCDAFSATLRIVIIVFALIFLGRMILSGVALTRETVAISFLSYTPLSLRAPPASH